jgi:DHA1 family tetracycline resistance protein-like MFS transporter
MRGQTARVAPRRMPATSRRTRILVAARRYLSALPFATGTSRPPRPSRPSMAVLFLIVFLDLVGFGMILPVFPFYAERVGVSPSVVIFLNGLYSLGQLVGSPIWGALSDRVGRRPVLLGTLLANALANMLLAVADNGLSLAISRVVSGLAAGNISAAYAYVADVTDDSTRPRALGLLGAAFGLGFILGPAMGGLLAGSGTEGGDISRVAHAAAAMSVLAFVATLLRLPESLDAAKRAAAAAHPHGLKWRLALHPTLGRLLVATLIVISAISMLYATFALWGAERLGIGPRLLGWVFGYVGVLSVIVQGGALGRLSARFGPTRLARWGAMLSAVGLLMVAFAPTLEATLLPLGAFVIGGALFMPSLGDLVTATAQPTERGAALGLFQGAASLGRVVGPFLASMIAGVAGLRWPFVVGAVVAAVGATVVREPDAVDR